MNTITIVALVLIFGGGIGAILLTVGQSISSSKDKSDIINTTKQENIALKNDIKELRKERNELNNELVKRDNKLQKRNDKIIELSQRLSDKSEYIQNYLTGGNGYPVVDIEKFATDNYNENKGLFKLRIVSKFPIYNLTINVYDYDMLLNSFHEKPFTKNPVVTLTDFNKAKIIAFKLDELTPIQTQYLDKKIKLGSARFYIQIRARNNVYIEKIATIIYDNTIYFGYQVFILDGKLMEQGFTNNISEEIQAKLIRKLNSISMKNNFDLAE
ncbi:MAG: hypothetical protein V5804_01235 [Mucilaginibacter sp.]|uniref:hypothetical protein n=1 Tax=Mucilaginibacter sp. TaxID=1882438 RepID=UPI0034E60655